MIILLPVTRQSCYDVTIHWTLFSLTTGWWRIRNSVTWILFATEYRGPANCSNSHLLLTQQSSDFVRCLAKSQNNYATKHKQYFDIFMWQKLFYAIWHHISSIVACNPVIQETLRSLQKFITIVWHSPSILNSLPLYLKVCIKLLSMTTTQYFWQDLKLSISSGV